MYVVTRNCCTSGNCGKCHDITPPGQKLRCLQYGPTSDEATAKSVARYWQEYEVRVETVEEAQDSLEPSSLEYLRKRLTLENYSRGL